MIVLKDKNVKTRKIHSCFSCSRKFPSLSEMRYNVGVYDGDFCTTYTCKTCEEIFSLQPEDQYESGFVEYQLGIVESPEDLLRHLKENKKK